MYVLIPRAEQAGQDCKIFELWALMSISELCITVVFTGDNTALDPYN